MSLQRPGDPAPLPPAAFAERMARFAPFERPPRLAVAVSGGRDSLALALLADSWARAHGGSILALTVDHALRPESAAEARQVARWLAARGIAGETLLWKHHGAPPSGVQAAARKARYRLLAQRCIADGILHLLLAHQADDQAETICLRLLHDSGVDGLAGMSACVELPGLRVLRPLLDVSRESLAATLVAAGQGWLDDPSNSDPRFERARLRGTGLPAPVGALRDVADGMARLRRAREAATARALAALAWVHPLGAVLLDAEGLAALPERLACNVVARALVTSGGRDYTPRGAPLARLVAALRRPVAAGNSGRGRDRTLAGCRLLYRSGTWVVVRQHDPARVPGGAAAESAPSFAGATEPWEGRFRVAAGATVRPLGRTGWPAHREVLGARWPVPALSVIAEALPAVDGRLHPAAAFRPRQPLAAAGFFPCFAAHPAQMWE